eukprot:gene6890-5115_t
MKAESCATPRSHFAAPLINFRKPDRVLAEPWAPPVAADTLLVVGEDEERPRLFAKWFRPYAGLGFDGMHELRDPNT